MCLILFAHRAAPGYALVLAANRDEFFSRPTGPAGYWTDAPHVLAGRDLEKGGTWLGVTRDGRWAAITNYRDGSRPETGSRSRGELVARYLSEGSTAMSYAAAVASAAAEYHGFNLLVGDAKGVHYVSNRVARAQVLEPGIYGLSNHLLDTPWPKVERGKREMEALLGGNAEIRRSGCWRCSPTAGPPPPRTCRKPASAATGKNCCRPPSSARRTMVRGLPQCC